MSPITLAIAAFLVLALLVGVADYLQRRSLRALLIWIALLIIAVVVLGITTGFPGDGRQAFGNPFPVPLAVAIMFVCILLGMGANYLFFAKKGESFSWLDFARPFAVSPLVLLPLIGSLQGAALESIQLVCFALLAFQNGFFWQQVLKNAKPKTQ